MAIGSVSPVGQQQFFDNNGNPLAGGKLFFYEAGTTTPTPAYNDFQLTVPLSNPVILDAGGRAPQLFLAALTYKQVLQDALGVTIWSADNIVTPTALRSTSATTSVTGNVDSVPVPTGVISYLNFENGADVYVSGFAGGTAGQILIIRAGGNANVHLLHQAGGSPVGDRLFNFAQSGPTSLFAHRGIAVYVYLAPTWILITHEQGAAIRLPYSPAGFELVDGNTWANAGTWTVESGDILNLDYVLNGTSLTASIAITNSSINVGVNATHAAVRDWPYEFLSQAVAMPAIAGSSYQNAVMGNNALSAVPMIAFAKPDLSAWTSGTFHAVGQVTLDVR